MDKSALTIDYTYLVTGELDTIKQGTTTLADYAYDDLGSRTGVTFANGVTQAFGFDPVSRLDDLTNNLTGTAQDLSKTFAYNPASQITQETRSNDAYAFVKSNTNEAGVSNGLNQLTSYAGKSLTHDAKGNVTGFGTDTFAYSSENLMTSATVGGTGTTLGYDPLMRLYQTVAGASTSRFLYDGLDGIAEYNSANALQRRWVFDPTTGQPVVQYEGTGAAATNRRYLSADERGSIISVSDSTGASLGINAYDEYGIPKSPLTGRYGYTGQAWIPSAQLWYYKARVYHPQLGRFMQPDPIGYGGDGPNLYAYVLNDPINLVDPWGLEPLSKAAIKLSQQYFGNAINYGAVSIHFGSSMVPSGRPAITLGNEIHVARSGISNALLLHELTHVWQNQSGLYTMSQMFWIHVLSYVSGTDIYLILITPGSRFEDYTLEQQAEIVEACAKGDIAACLLIRKSRHFRNSRAKSLVGEALIPLYPIVSSTRGEVIVEQGGSVEE